VVDLRKAATRRCSGAGTSRLRQSRLRRVHPRTTRSPCIRLPICRRRRISTASVPV
jgi:hypothetical protein